MYTIVVSETIIRAQKEEYHGKNKRAAGDQGVERR